MRYNPREKNQVLDELENLADQFIAATNDELIKTVLEKFTGKDNAGPDLGNFPIRDNADLAAASVVEVIDLYTDRQPTEGMADDDARDMMTALAETIRQATVAAPTMANYETLAPVERPTQDHHAVYIPPQSEWPKDWAERVKKFVEGLPDLPSGTSRNDVVEVASEYFVEMRDKGMAPEEAIRKVEEAVDDLRIENLTSEMRYYFGTAEEWSKKPNLTIEEACHGVARAAYLARFNPAIPREPVKSDFDGGIVYDSAYDHRYKDKIRERSIRSAKELFGS